MVDLYRHCNCGAPLTFEAWEALPFGGIWQFGDGDAQVLRTHSCGSTLVQQVLPAPAFVYEDEMEAA